jgi:hypothetical protein
MSTTTASKVEEAHRLAIDRTRGLLSTYAERAAQILQELAEYGDNERIRLSAVNSILDRVGVVAPMEVKVTASPEEHQLIRGEAEQVLERIKANAEKQAERSRPKELATLMVLESEGDEVDASSS